MASNLTVDSISKGATTLNTDEIVDTNSAQACKAWINFNGQGTVAIGDSYNVTSLVDNGTGIYTINFTNAMPNAFYSVTTSNGSDVNATTLNENLVLTTSFRLHNKNNSNVFSDPKVCNAIVFK